MPQWLLLSGAGALTITPLLALIGIAGRFVGAPNTVLWYTSGLTLGCFLVPLMRIRGGWGFAELAPTGWSCALLFGGATVGVLANWLIFKGAALAPNPGLPFVVCTAANFLSVPVGALALFLVHRYFGATIEPQAFSAQQAVGVLFVCLGVFFFVRA